MAIKKFQNTPLENQQTGMAVSFEKISGGGATPLWKQDKPVRGTISPEEQLSSANTIAQPELTPAAQWVDATVREDNLDPTSIRSAGAVKSLAQSVQSFKEAGKQRSSG